MAIAGLLVGLVLVLVLVGRKAPGSGLEQLGWKSERELLERREALEAEDVEQMVAAATPVGVPEGSVRRASRRSRSRLWTTSASSAAATRHI